MDLPAPLLPARDGAVDWGKYAAAVERWEALFDQVAPYPIARGPRGGRKVSPAFVEWFMGLPPGWVSEVPGVGLNAALRLLGNAVMPQQAALALRLLELEAA